MLIHWTSENTGIGYFHYPENFSFPLLGFPQNKVFSLISLQTIPLWLRWESGVFTPPSFNPSCVKFNSFSTWVREPRMQWMKIWYPSWCLSAKANWEHGSLSAQLIPLQILWQVWSKKEGIRKFGDAKTLVKVKPNTR